MAYDRYDRYDRSDRAFGRDRDRFGRDQDFDRGRYQSQQQRDAQQDDVPDSYAQDRFLRGWFEDDDDRNQNRGRDRDEDREYSRWRGGRRGFVYSRDYQGRGDFDRDRQPRSDRDERDERGFFDRASDEVASWFGDEEAERRRERDVRRGSWYGRYGYDQDRYPRGERERDDEDRSARPMYWTASDRDYRSGTSYGPAFDRSGRIGSERGYNRDEFGRASKYGRDDYRRTSFAGSTAPSNQEEMQYQNWRRRQMEQLDRDYDDFCRENEARFESDFGSWRQQREGKRQMLGGIPEHAEVVGSDGEHVGTVDCVRGDRIVLTRSDPQSGGIHHSIGCAMVDSVDDGKVTLNVDAEQARQRWRDEDSGSAMFSGREGDGDRMLNRSFSGTYR